MTSSCATKGSGLNYISHGFYVIVMLELLTTSFTSFCMLLWMPMMKGVGVERISRIEAGRMGTYVCV